MQGIINQYLKDLMRLSSENSLQQSSEDNNSKRTKQLPQKSKTSESCPPSPIIHQKHSSRLSQKITNLPILTPLFEKSEAKKAANNNSRRRSNSNPDQLPPSNLIIKDFPKPKLILPSVNPPVKSTTHPLAPPLSEEYEDVSILQDNTNGQSIYPLNLSDDGHLRNSTSQGTPLSRSATNPLPITSLIQPSSEDYVNNRNGQPNPLARSATSPLPPILLSQSDDNNNIDNIPVMRSAELPPVPLSLSSEENHVGQNQRYKRHLIDNGIARSSSESLPEQTSEDNTPNNQKINKRKQMGKRQSGAFKEFLKDISRGFHGLVRDPLAPLKQPLDSVC